MSRLRNQIANVLCVTGVLGAMATQAAPEKYRAALSSMPYSDATRAVLKGRGTATIVLDGNKLTVTGRFAGLAGQATAANLMLGLGIGVPGSMSLPLEISRAPEGTLSGQLVLNEEQLIGVRRGRMYIQINSEASPTGTLWGWILPDHPEVIQDEPVAGHGFLPQLDIKP
jgi:hypothetical protein